MSISQVKSSNSSDNRCGCLSGLYHVCRHAAVKVRLLWERLCIFLVRCFEWVKNQFIGAFSESTSPLDSAENYAAGARLNRASRPPSRVLRNPSEDSPSALISSESAELQNQRTELRNAVQGILTFLTPPSTLEYEDEQSGKTYHVPDHSHLLPLAANYFTNKEYQSYGINRKQILSRPEGNVLCCCDLIYFVKHDDQVRFENRSTFSPASFTGIFTNMEERIENQKQKCLEYYGFVKKKAKEWDMINFIFFIPGKVAGLGIFR